MYRLLKTSSVAVAFALLLAITPSANAQSAAVCVFTRDLSFGTQGADVRCLQQYLNSAGFTVSKTGAGSPGQETDYFGIKLRRAVSDWQTKNGISPARGYFGALSRAKYYELTGAPTTSQTPGVSRTVDNTAFNAITDLTLTPYSASAAGAIMQLDWTDNNMSEDLYVVERATSTPSLFAIIGQSTSSIYSFQRKTFYDASAVGTTTYYYRVSPVGWATTTAGTLAYVTGPSSNIASAAMPSYSSPGEPIIANVAKAYTPTNGEVLLRFSITDPTRTATRFLIERSTTASTSGYQYYRTLKTDSCSTRSYQTCALWFSDSVPRNVSSNYFYRVTPSNRAGTGWTATRIPTFKIGDSPIINYVQQYRLLSTTTSYRWQTDLATTGKLEIATSTSFRPEIKVATPWVTTNHEKTVTGLTPNTRYYARMSVRDATGTTLNPYATSSIESFRTSGSATTTLTMSNVRVTDITPYRATMRWETNLPSTSYVFAGVAPAVYPAGSEWQSSDPVLSHTVELAGLQPRSTYNYTASSQYLVGGKVTSYASSGIGQFRTLDVASTSLSAITVTSPNGGESFRADTLQLVRWTSDKVNCSVSVFLQTSGVGSITQRVLVRDTANTGSALWLVPRDIPSGQYRLRVVIGGQNCTVPISGESSFDDSDGTFSISGTDNPALAITITSPALNDTLIIGRNYETRWDVDGDLSSVNHMKLYLDRNGTILGRIDHVLSESDGISPLLASYPNYVSYRPLGSQTYVNPPAGSGYRIVAVLYGIYNQELARGVGRSFSVAESPTTTQLLPDLSITNISADAENKTILVRVCNTGSAIAPNISIDTKRSEDNASPLHYAVFNGANLGVNECYSFGTGGWSYFNALPGNSYFFSARVDARNEVAELSKLNNSLTAMVAIPGVSVVSPITVISPNGGQTFTAGGAQVIRWAGGGQDWKINVGLLSADRTSSLPLAVGITNDGSETVTIPTNTLNGKYYVNVWCTTGSCAMPPLFPPYPGDTSNELITVAGGLGLPVTTQQTSTLPVPQLSYLGSEDYTANGQNWTQFKLSVTNWSSYASDLFASAPDLPACGLNTNSSRTWVNIYNGTTKAYIYGFCSLGTASGLTQLWFAIPRGSTPPASVYITLNDRKTGTTVQSAPLTIPVSVTLFTPEQQSLLDRMTALGSLETAVQALRLYFGLLAN